MNDVRQVLTIEELASRIRTEHSRKPSRVLLVGISGIDGSGKSFVTRQLAAKLSAGGICVANVALDPWRTAPSERFDVQNPGETFYRNAYRFDALFETLVTPLQQTGTVDIQADLRRSDGSKYRERIQYSGVNVILLEGLFLFKESLRDRFDLRIWIQCSFETALNRALDRNQEGKPPEALVADYQTFYVPAQKIHMRVDTPDRDAHLVFLNDT
jgi:uridine kinase